MVRWVAEPVGAQGASRVDVLIVAHASAHRQRGQPDQAVGGAGGHDVLGLGAGQGLGVAGVVGEGHLQLDAFALLGGRGGCRRCRWRP